MGFNFDALAQVSGDCYLLTAAVQLIFLTYIVAVVVGASDNVCNVPLYHAHVVWLITPFTFFVGMMTGLFGSEHLGSLLITVATFASLLVSFAILIMVFIADHQSCGHLLYYSSVLLAAIPLTMATIFATLGLPRPLDKLFVASKRGPLLLQSPSPAYSSQNTARDQEEGGTRTATYPAPEFQALPH